MHFNSKYKDRTPRETVELIKSIFSERGFELESVFEMTCINTWSSHHILYYDRKNIIESNGKGLTKELCEASGISELFERFCIEPFFDANVVFRRKSMLLNKDNSFCYRPDEKIISSEYVLNIPFIDRNVLPWFRNNVELRKKIIEKYCDGTIVGLPFVNIFTKEIVYIDNKIFTAINGSNGSAAGNSFIEAFNQGYSELLERKAQKEFFRKEGKPFKLIDEKYISEPNLLELLNTLKKQGRDYWIIDCFDFVQGPVLGLIVLDRESGHLTTSFGAFPIFEIALERCITEMMQGNSRFEGQRFQVQFPYYLFEDSEQLAINESFRSVASYHQLNERRFDPKGNKEEPDSRFLFACDNHDNNSIYNFWLNYIKEHNLDVFVLDTSIDKRMSCVRIFEMEGEPYHMPEYFFPNTSKENHDIIFGQYKLYEDLYDTLCGDYDFMKFYEASDKISRIPEDRQKTIGFLFGLNNDPYSLNRSVGIPSYTWDFIKGLCRRNFEICLSLPLFNRYWFNKYELLNKYVATGKYSKDEIKNFLWCFGYEYTDEDFNNIFDFKYVFENAVYKPLWEYWHSEKYDKFVLSSNLIK